MGQKGGSRGQSQVIGAVLIFGFIIAALGSAQVVLVPQANEEVEFNHNDRAQQDMQEVRSAIQRSAAVGSSQSESVDLTPGYPTRFLLLNPGEGAGTIRTEGGTGGSSLVVEDARATDDEVNDFWDGSGISATNRQLIYSPSYNYYTSAPGTVYENTVLYNTFSDGANVSQSDQDIIDDRRINLVALDGDKSTSQPGAAAVDVKPVSPATEKITVERNGAGNPVKITIPTQLSEEVWIQDLLAEEIDDSGDGQAGPEDGDRCDGPNAISGTDQNDRFIVACNYDDTTTPNELTLTLQEENQNNDPVTYKLRMAKVGVGTDISTPTAEYITGLKGDDADVVPSERQEVVFQVRNKYNNPAEDAEVDVEIDGGASGQKLLNNGNDITGESDDNIPVGPDGKVELTYVAPGDTDSGQIDVDIRAKFDSGSFGGDGAKDAVVSMDIINPSRVDRTQPLANPPDGVVLQSANIQSDSCSKEKVGPGKDCDVMVTWQNQGSQDVDVEGIRAVFFNADSQGAASASSSGITAKINSPSKYAGTILPVGGDRKKLTPPLTIEKDTANNEESIVFEFTNKDGKEMTVNDGDLLIISLIIDGERETYFISPSS